MSVFSNIATQIIDSIPHIACIFDLKHQKLQHINIHAKKLLNLANESSIFPENLLKSIFKIEKDERLFDYWKHCLKLNIGELCTTDCWLQVATDDFQLFEITVTALIDKVTGSPFLFIYAQRKPGAQTWQLEQDFINLAAHDLHSPVRKMSTFIGSLKKKFPEILDNNEYMTRLENSIGSMREIISSLSEFSQASLEQLHPENISLGEIIDQVLCEIRPLVEGKNITIIRGDLPLVKADKKQCRILFRHIIENAVRFRLENIKTIIRIESAEFSHEAMSFPIAKKHDFCKVTISDNGTGFPASRKNDIFKPFVRLHGRSEMGGNGMGLAICRRIALNLGWEIYGESGDTFGTCFTLLLPHLNIVDV